MQKNKIILNILIILLIFFIGFFIRIEFSNINGISAVDKGYYQDQDGIPYMIDMDSYYNYRLTKNYLDHGYLGNIKINGTEWDSYSYYPPGVPLDYPPFLIYITAFVYNFINLFIKISLLNVCFWLPAFIAPLCGIPAYFFVKRLTNEYGGLVAGILAVTAPFYIIRTVPGWFDTDMFIILFSIMVVWLFIEALQNNDKRKQIILAFSSTLFMFLFSLAWNGWQYVFYVIIVISILYIIWSKIKGKNINKIAYITGIFILCTISLVLIFTGILNISKLIFGVLDILKVVNNQNIWSPWPNIYNFIIELQPPSIKYIIAGLGIILSLISILGTFLILKILIKKNPEKNFKINWFIYLFLVAWAIISIFTLKEGNRFLLLVIPPLAIISGITVGFITDYIKNLNKKSLNKLLSISIIILITSLSILSAYNPSFNIDPRVDDNLWNTAVWINNNTSNDTVIITSWVYGHFFAAIADRPVIFDGRLGYIETLPVRHLGNSYSFGEKSPSTSREYWIDHALSSSNESLSIGIFRMLSTSGDLAYLTLCNYTNNSTKSIEILNNILGVNKKTASRVLINYNLSAQQSKKILEFTHPDNPKPFVFVTYDKMIDDGYWIFSIGNWNYLNETSEKYFYSFGKITQFNNTLKSDDNLTMNLKSPSSIMWGNNIPYCVIINSKGNLKKIYLDKESNFCVILNMDNNKSIIIDKSFENSLFTKLVLEKRGDSNFKPIYKSNDTIIWNTESNNM